MMSDQTTEPGRSLLVGPAVMTVVGLIALASNRWVLGLIGLSLAMLQWHALTILPRYRSAVARVPAVIGAGLTTLLLAPLFVPLAVLATSWRALAQAFGRPGSLGWRHPPASTPRSTRRSFGPRTPGTSDGWAVRRAVLRTVVVLLSIQLLAVSIIHFRKRETTVEFQGVSDPGAIGTAAAEGLPWAQALLEETGEVTRGQTFSSYTGHALRDHRGRYVNVSNQMRKTFEPNIPAGVRPLEVWFFGGSTMFGFDLQRDDHTIASNVARMASAAGIPVHVRNYGSPGYVNYTEVVQLQLLLGQGLRPDVVVFYDGTNDVSARVLATVDGRSSPVEPEYLEASFMRRNLALQNQYVDDGTQLPAQPLVPRRPARPITVAGLVSSTIDVYRQGLDLAKVMGAHYEFDVVPYWQPDIYSRTPLAPGEHRVIEQLEVDGYQEATVRALEARVRAALPAEVNDLATAMDDVRGAVYTDQAHTNELGAEAVARAMFRTLGPRLRAVWERHQE